MFLFGNYLRQLNWCPFSLPTWSAYTVSLWRLSLIGGPNSSPDSGEGFVRTWGIDLSFSSAYHPQTNGAAERANQNIEKYLRCFISEQQDNWSDLLPWAEYALNSAVSESTGHSPFFAVYGFDPPVLPDTFPDTTIPALDEQLASLKETWGRVRRALEESSAIQKTKADRHRRQAPVYQVGDRVWLSSRNIKLLVPSMKLAPRYIGPYKILRRLNPVSYALALPPHFKIHNVFHVNLLKPLLCNRYTQVPCSTASCLCGGRGGIRS
uniref:Integrase catalytic domain-containing protein n=1 Tax=Leptobrachium leishanense TaxID=445787 RepID=A0A8C5WJ11_9ANUR